MKLYDISVPFSPMLPVYPGDPPLEILEHMQIAQGAVANLSVLRFGSHTGTHIDAPRHFFNDGKALDELPLERFICRALVADMRGKPRISARDLDGLEINEGDAVLLRTDNAARMREKKFYSDYVYLTGDAARLLAKKRAVMVGIDYLSVEGYDAKGFQAHRELLSREVILLEGLDLSGVDAGSYTLVALPLCIPGGNGSPVRAVLIKE